LSKTTHSLLTFDTERPAGEHPADHALTYRFGPFLLDTARRLLMRGAEVKPLPEKPFQALLLLLEADGELVPKEAFFERSWPGEIVTDANLAQHIFMLRGMLGESARDHAYIVTVAGRGYRFATRIEAKSGLAMKGSCERCGTGLPHRAAAFICSYECTFCGSCAEKMKHGCPNCGGELLRRPRRV
jgi:DNA-binding winged helix-turn-helix (wHTH) protein